MSQQTQSPKSMTSGEILAAYRRVKISGSTVVYADAGEEGIGVVQAAVATSGNEATVRLDNAGGTSKMMASAAITAGVDVYPADDGKISATKIGRSIGTALEAATADGDIIEVLPISGSDVPADSARSRTAVQLPTSAIIGLFDIDGMLRNPLAGSLLLADFTRPGDMPDVIFVDATYAASAAGKTPTEGLYIGTGASGELKLFATTDNQAAECQWSVPITTSGAGAWAFGVRIKQSVLTDTKAGWFSGLMVPSLLAGNLIVDAGTLQTEGSLGFQCKEGDGDKIDLIYDKTGQTQNEHDDDYVTQVANTYNTLELYCNGTTIQGYVDGVATGTAISAADIAAADFPAATVMVPTLALKNAHADDFTATVDWIYAVQAAT